MNERERWVAVAERLARPPLEALAAGRLRATLPVRGRPERAEFAPLEALGRLLAGLAPWLELGGGDDPEGRLRGELGELARRAIGQGCDPASPDRLNFHRGQQPLVDTAFLAQALLRAPQELLGKLAPDARDNLIAGLEATRDRKPGFNNWLLFAAMTEVALRRLGRPWDRMRVDYAVRQHDQWYLGDGVYGDGPQFHWDYYNSFVIQPMLVEVLEQVAGEDPAWDALADRARVRLTRHAAIQERLISPEGTYPPVGRSLAYRCGAFQVLALAALRSWLPADVTPAQVRGALTAVIDRQLTTPGTFDDAGWLTIGLCGEQPGLGENYISGGSVYLCAVGLLPLGLPSTAEFWTAPPTDWTAKRYWAGGPATCDHAL